MERHIEVHPESRRVEVTFHGPVSFLDRIATLDIVMPMIVEGGLTRVLIDYSHAWVDSPSVLSFEMLEKKLRDASCMRGLWIALVNPPEFHALPTEAMAEDTGFQVRRFYNRDAAVAWLADRLTPPSRPGC
jgi:hypothetical protein